MSLESVLMGLSDTESAELAGMTNAEVAKRFGYNRGYVTRIRSKVRNKKIKRKIEDSVARYEGRNDWVDRTSQLAEILKSIAESPVGRGND